MMSRNRTLEGLVRGMPTSDGAGVKLTRVLTQNLQRRLDPFLMLDYFHSDDPNDYIAGFPEHPHRGFETVTYMLAGRMRHRDSAGNEGLLGPGGVQWMTAGKGIQHSEMPEQEAGLMQGFQLWLNLPGKNKLAQPDYQDIQGNAIPETHPADGVKVRVIAGEAFGVTGAKTRPDTEPLFLDAHLQAGKSITLEVPESHNAFLYVWKGEVKVAGNSIPTAHMGVLHNDGDSVTIEAVGDVGILLIAGKPLNEPIVQWGPFVMNTRAEIETAIEDYRNGRIAVA
ncbi:pirin family protein [Burkholderiaceae bacterium DAT-1]|nr:pirin family protein [Burkholderiaceae bacterium DAT-1]